MQNVLSIANRQLNGVELVLQASWHTEANAPIGAVQRSEAIRPGWVNNGSYPHIFMHIGGSRGESWPGCPSTS